MPDVLKVSNALFRNAMPAFKNLHTYPCTYLPIYIEFVAFEEKIVYALAKLPTIQTFLRDSYFCQFVGCNFLDFVTSLCQVNKNGLNMLKP